MSPTEKTPIVKLNILKESNFKLIIPKNVEQKIRYHIHRFPTTEWSGYMFYDYTGSFEENNLVFTARDFVVLDIGSATQTSFDDSAKVVNYQIEHDLLDCMEALIHSHHRMGAFFSGTDDNAIRQEALNVNHFLSLVVDTKGTYVARVTKRNIIKATVKQEITKEVCYPTYGGKMICSEEASTSESVYDQQLSEVVVYPLTVEVEACDSMSEWEKDIEEIYSLKRSVPASSTTNTTIHEVKEDFEWPTSSAYHHAIHSDYPRERSLFAEYSDPPTPLSETKVTVDPKEVNLFVLKILSLDMLCTSQMVSQTPQFAVTLPDKVKAVFDTDLRYFTFLDGFVELVFNDFMEDCQTNLLDEIGSTLAAKAQERLKNLPGNRYITHIINLLNSYII